MREDRARLTQVNSLDVSQDPIDLTDPIESNSSEREQPLESEASNPPVKDRINAIKQTTLPLYELFLPDGTLLRTLQDTGASSSFVSPHVVSHLFKEPVSGREVELLVGAILQPSQERLRLTSSHVLAIIYH